MTTLTYSKNGKAYSDFESHNAVLQTLGKQEDLHCSTEITVHYARALFAQGLIPEFEVQYIDGKEVHNIIMNEKARFDYWPKGFCDHMDNCLDILL